MTKKICYDWVHPDTATAGQRTEESERRVHAAVAGFGSLLPPEGGVPQAAGCVERGVGVRRLA